MASHNDFELERLLDLVLLDEADNYKNKWPAWSHAHATAVNGAMILAQAAMAAHETVPQGFDIHFIQAQFVKASSKELALRYEVRRVSTGGKAASRVVAVKQESVVRAIVTIGFSKVAAEDEALHSFDHIAEPSPDSRAAAAQSIDPDLDDANYGKPGATGRARNSPNWPIPNMYFPISCQRLHVRPHADISQRIYRIKLQTTCPLSSPQAQIRAIIFLSDHFVGDTPLTVRGIDFGMSRIGDRTKTVHPSSVRVAATLNHSLYFCRAEGGIRGRGSCLSVRWCGRREEGVDGVCDSRC